MIASIRGRAIFRLAYHAGLRASEIGLLELRDCEPRMQLYDRGIRRRTAPMLGNDRRRLELAHSLIMTLPGTPVLRNGDEIGMGENLDLPERDAIRTPMQWANAKNGGFSPAKRVVLPVISGGEFGFEKVNVAAEQRDPESFLNWIERMTRLRLRSPEFGMSRCEWLEASDPAVLAHCCRGEKSSIFAVHNLSGREVETTVDLGRKVEGLFDLMKNCEAHVDEGGRQRFRLGAVRVHVAEGGSQSGKPGQRDRLIEDDMAQQPGRGRYCRIR